MGALHGGRLGNGDQRQCQRRYLMNLQQHIGLSYREMAERSKALVAFPDLRFTHQAISKWFRGTSQPSHKGREFLSIVFKVSPAEIAQRCGIAREPIAGGVIPVTVHTVDVNGHGREYRLHMRKDLDLSQPSLVHNWAYLFQQGPGILSRHFKSLSNRLCGYAPFEIRPYINHPRSVVLIETEHKAFDRLESPDKRLWFACLPDGSLEISLLFLDETGTRLIVAKPGDDPSKWRAYERDQIQPIGYLGHRILFYFDPEPQTALRPLNGFRGSDWEPDERDFLVKR